MTELDTRSQILIAAEERFSLYGYNKTTMVEIASDCNMSAANLYRFFDNKLDIGAGLANQCLAEKENELAVIVADNLMTSAEKLHAFVVNILHYTYRRFDVAPRLSELIEAMTIQRPEVMKSHRNSTIILLRRLLEQSVDAGEFEFSDIDATAEAINTAITVFYLPAGMPLFSLEEFESKAKSVCDLLVNGLSKIKT